MVQFFSSYLSRIYDKYSAYFLRYPDSYQKSFIMGILEKVIHKVEERVEKKHHNGQQQ